MAKRRRPPFDPFAGQPTTRRRPGAFNEQADARPDPNAAFLPTQAYSVGSSGGWFAGLLRRRRHRSAAEDRGPVADGDGGDHPAP
jgi:hypothetical protein